MASSRTTTEVFQDHLTKRLAGDIDGDLRDNYAEDVVLLTGTGAFHGHEGMRQSSAELNAFVTDHASFAYNHTLIEGEYAFLEWTSKSGERSVCDGADGFVIKNGKIIMQTIHYSVHKNE